MRYANRQAYLDQDERALESLVRDRFMLADDVRGALRLAERTWNVIVGR